MTCSACSSHVEKAVGKLIGVEKVTVNLLQNFMVVEYDEKAIGEAEIIQAVTSAGYGASSAENKTKKIETDNSVSSAAAAARQMKNRLILSILFLIPLMYVAMGPMIGLPMPSFLTGLNNAIAFGMTQLILTLIIVSLNHHYFTNGFKSLAKRAPTMDALIAIGTSAAIVYGIYAIIRMGYGLAIQDFALVEQYHMDMYFESAGTILTLITVGKYLESRSKGKTSDAINRLLGLTPKTAWIEKDGIETEIPISDVVVGDILIVKAGSSVPVDGRITEGAAAIDESAITGESLPVEKTIGDSVTGATVSRAGFFKMTAIRVGEDTTLAQIIRLVEEASAGKAPISKLADRISAVFVPIVISISILATIIWLLLGYPLNFALSIGIAVLVISCPCALGLATPTAIMVGTGKGAENGILFKNAESIETTHSANIVILDKTGTVTNGKPAVTGIYPADGTSVEDLISYAATAEKLSEHPLAAAIVEKAKEMNCGTEKAKKFKQIAGQGIQAQIWNGTISAGNSTMMKALGVEISGFEQIFDEIARKGQTPIYIAKENVLLGVVSIADTIKPTSKNAVAEFKNMGIDVILLTGDNEKTANAIAGELGINHVIAGVLPEGKEKTVREQQDKGKKVVMIGDGINDAPALARADVGIAIGAGTDVAIESADVVLMKSDLMNAVTAFKLSKATIRNIKQNLFWAFFYNVMGIPLAAGVFYSILGWKLNPMFAAAAMSLSSFFVVTNALRLRFFKPKYTTDVPIQACPIDFETEPENKNIEKTESSKYSILMKIDGMTCINCKKHVERALTSIPGIQAAVDLETKTAQIFTDIEIDDETLEQTITKEGFTVVSIQR